MRAINRVLVLLMIISSFAAAAAAQTKETAGLTEFPVPAWPANGVIGAEQKDHYVFIDLAKNEYVLAYPENLGSATFEKDGPGPLRTARYELLRNVEPTVAVAITSANQKYKYTYTVADAASAKQSIDQFAISIPEQAAGAAMKGPDGWFALTQKGRAFKVKNPQWIKTGAAAVWSFEKPEETIPPGSSKGGFEIESDLRPGFTLGYFRKAESVETVVATSGFVPGGNGQAAIPKAVKDDLDALMAVEYNSKTLAIVGPKFAKDADDKTIAGDYLEGIATLGRTGGLDPNSDFVKTATTDLKTIQSGGAAKVSATAKTPAETQILNAMKVSLHLN